MKVIIAIIVCGIIAGCANTGSSPIVKQQEKTDTIPKEATLLSEAYQKKNDSLFFNAFPGTFQGFINLYGYDDKAGQRALYSSYVEHIDYFFRVAKKTPSFSYGKQFDIASGGKWDADAPSYFRHKLAQLLLDDTKVITNVIAEKPKNEVVNFWYFLFDGSKEKASKEMKEEFLKIYKEVDAVNHEHAEILKQKFNSMYR